MSTLRLTTISNQSGSATVPSETVINGSAKAWVNFNGTGTVAIRASYNVSSITDNGTGDYTVNFTNAMSDSNYSSVVGTGFSSTWQAGIALNTTSSFVESAPTTSSFRFACVAFNASTGQDPKYCNVSVFR